MTILISIAVWFASAGLILFMCGPKPIEELANKTLRRSVFSVCVVPVCTSVLVLHLAVAIWNALLESRTEIKRIPYKRIWG